MKSVSIDQSHEVMAKLSTNTDWTQLDGDVLQTAVKDPKRLGEQFTLFLKLGGKVIIGEPRIIPIVGEFNTLKSDPSENGIDPRLEEWKKFYKDHLNLDVDFSGVKIPEKRKGFYRLIVVAQGLTLNQVYDACAKKFPCYRYADDLDAAVPTNDRDTQQSYAIWVRERVEADKEHKNRSADDLKESEVESITLLERMLFELKYFTETEKHLDLENWTLCAGSRDSDGFVPYAHWFGSKFCVGWDGADDADPLLRCREVVTL